MLGLGIVVLGQDTYSIGGELLATVFLPGSVLCLADAVPIY